METLTLQITGMACGGCAATVTSALLNLSGVSAAEVSHTDGRARIAYDPASIRPAEIKAAIEAAGYSAA